MMMIFIIIILDVVNLYGTISFTLLQLRLEYESHHAQEVKEEASHQTIYFH